MHQSVFEAQLRGFVVISLPKTFLKQIQENTRTVHTHALSGSRIHQIVIYEFKGIEIYVMFHFRQGNFILHIFPSKNRQSTLVEIGGKCYPPGNILFDRHRNVIGSSLMSYSVPFIETIPRFLCEVGRKDLAESLSRTNRIVGKQLQIIREEGIKTMRRL